MSKPCILQVIPALHSGGAEKTAIDVALAVREKGWNAVIASTGGRLVEKLEKSGAIHVTLPLESKNPLTIWQNARRLQSVIKKYNANIVHARSRAPAWSALLAARREKIPFVTTYHGAYNQTNRAKALYNSVMARGDVIIANSHWTSQLVEERYPQWRDRIVTIARGTDFSEFQRTKLSTERKQRLLDEWKIPKDTFVVLHLSRISPRKDQINVVAAAKLLAKSHPNICYVLAGDHLGRETYHSKLMQEIASARLQNVVFVPGHCDDPPAALSLADVVLSTARSPETFGRVPVEASALEKPTIVTMLGAVGETVLAPPDVPPLARTGWKIGHSDPQALAGAIVEVQNLDSKQIQQIGLNGRAFVLDQFSLENMCEKTIQVYTSLLN